MNTQKGEVAICVGCQQLKTTRPFGPNKGAICFDCAMKDPLTTGRNLAEKAFGPVASTFTDERILKAVENTNLYCAEKKRLADLAGLPFDPGW